MYLQPRLDKLRGKADFRERGTCWRCGLKDECSTRDTSLQSPKRIREECELRLAGRTPSVRILPDLRAVQAHNELSGILRAISPHVVVEDEQRPPTVEGTASGAAQARLALRAHVR